VKASDLIKLPVDLKPADLLGFAVLVIAVIIVAKHLPVVGKQL
jgi:hypothetical protein